MDFNQLFSFPVRYIVYILTVQGATGLCTMCYDMLYKRLKTERLKNTNWFLIIYIACIGILISNNQKFYAEDFPLIFIAFLIVEYPEVVSLFLYFYLRAKKHGSTPYTVSSN